MEVPQLALRDLPEELGSFQTARKRLIRWAVDGTWEKIFAAVLAAADAVDDIGWTVAITNDMGISWRQRGAAA